MRGRASVLIVVSLGCGSSTSWRYLDPAAGRADATAAPPPPSMTRDEPPLTTIERAHATLAVDGAPVAMDATTTSERHGPVVTTTLRGALPRVENATVTLTLALPADAALARVASDDPGVAPLLDAPRFDARGGTVNRIDWWASAAGPAPTFTAAYTALDTRGDPGGASDGTRFVAWIRVPGEPQPDPLDAVTVLVDTSHPTAGDALAPAATALIAALAARMPQASVRLVAFDDAPVELAAGPAVEVARRAPAALAAHGELGASDLAAALAFAAGADRVIVVGDATATAGDDPITAARTAQLGRIDVLVPGFERGRRGAMALVDAGARPGRVLVATDDALLPALDGAVSGALALAVDGATDVWPATIAGLPPGSPVALTGRLRVPGDLVVRVGAAPPVTLPLAAARAASLAALADRIAWAAQREARASASRGSLVLRDDGRVATDVVGTDDAIGVPWDTEATAYVVVGHGDGCRPIDPLGDARGDHPATSCFPHGASNPNPLYQPLHEVLRAIARGDAAAAFARARAAYLAQPDSAIAIVALGEALEAHGAPTLAARAYRGLVDQRAATAPWWRLTAERLDRLGAPARPLAIATYREALRRAPGHVGAQRRLAIALVRAGDHAGAIAALREALDGASTDGARALLRDELAVVLAVARSAAPAAVAAAIAATGVQPATTASRRVVLDLEAAPNRPMRTSGLRMTAESAPTAVDVALGDGPATRATSDAPTVFAARDRDAHVRLTVRDAGFAGACVGVVQLVDHDGRGGLVVEDRPFVLAPHAGRVDLGRTTPAPRKGGA